MRSVCTASFDPNQPPRPYISVQNNMLLITGHTPLGICSTCAWMLQDCLIWHQHYRSDSYVLVTNGLAEARESKTIVIAIILVSLNDLYRQPAFRFQQLTCPHNAKNTVDLYRMISNVGVLWVQLLGRLCLLYVSNCINLWMLVLNCAWFQSTLITWQLRDNQIIPCRNSRLTTVVWLIHGYADGLTLYYAVSLFIRRVASNP